MFTTSSSQPHFTSRHIGSFRHEDFMFDFFLFFERECLIIKQLDDALIKRKYI